MLVASVGLGLSTAPATSAIVSDVPTDEQGVAAAVNDAMREIGAAIGIALFALGMVAAGAAVLLIFVTPGRGYRPQGESGAGVPVGTDPGSAVDIDPDLDPHVAAAGAHDSAGPAVGPRRA